MSKFKLGQKISFNQVMKREYITRDVRKKGSPNKKWIYKPYKKNKGIIIGVRTLFDSHVSYWEDHTECENVNPQKALLVSFDLKRKPVFIPQKDYLIEYKFVNFNPVRKRRGVEAASFQLFIDGESKGYVWMNKRDITYTIRDFGNSPELQKSLRCYS